MPDLDKLIANEFRLDPGLVYINHAAVAPWPTRTAEAVQKFAEDNRARGSSHYPQWLEIEQQLRDQFRLLLNAPSSDDIALTKNTSEGLSIVAHGMPWKPGDNVVTSDEEFPSNRIVWESLRDRGVQVKRVALNYASPENSLLTALDERTRLLAISSVQYASGLRVDLQQLGEACRHSKVAFCVDAIQGLGVTPHDVQTCHIDFLAADGHKWLLGPEGVAVFYCAGSWREQLQLHEYGWHMVEDHMNFDRLDWTPARSARRFECGSPNMLGIHGLQASLGLILEAGPANVQQRILDNARVLIAAISERDELELITPHQPLRHAGIVTFRHRHTETDVLYEKLVTSNIVCAKRGGGIRLSPHCYNTATELQRAIEVACA